MYVKILFTCRKCGIDEFPVEVLPRKEGEAIKDFVDRVMRRCMSCHRVKSPKCGTKQLDLYIPQGEKLIGGEGEPSPERTKELRDALEGPGSEE